MKQEFASWISLIFFVDCRNLSADWNRCLIDPLPPLSIFHDDFKISSMEIIIRVPSLNHR
jgi:hypothetical protein